MSQPKADTNDSRPATAQEPRRDNSGQGAPAPGETQPGETRRPKEVGGPRGPEPTRYGDWERKGICYDF